MRRWRRRAGLSQARLADAAGCSESLINKVERGVLGLDSLKLALRIARVLGMPPAELLGLGSTTPGDGRDDRLTPDSLGEEADGVNRRDTLKTVSVLGGTLAIAAILDALDPDEGDLLLAAMRDPVHNLNQRVVRLLERIDVHHQKRSHMLPAEQRLRATEAHLAMVRRLRPHARGTDSAWRLAIVEVQAARLVGRLRAYWRGDRNAAEHAFQMALAAAHDAGPQARSLRAYSLGGIAFLETTTRRGDRRAAVAAVTQALELAGTGRVPGARGLGCWLVSTAATVHAGVGDRRACTRALGQAEELYVPPGAGDPAWLGFLGRGLLLEDRAACQLRIGQPARALATLEQAEELVRPGRLQRRAVILAYRAEALVRAGQLTDGCQVARDALEVAMPIGYRRVIADITTLRRLRLHKARSTPAVKEVDELLRLAGNSA